MSGAPSIGKDSLPHFHLTEVYPEAAEVFAVALPPLESVKDTAIVVLDTNVLLVPFTVGPKSVDEIRVTYSRLAHEQRLVVPAQVAREFAKNRAAKIGEVYQRFARERSKVTAPAMDRYPLLEPLKEYGELRDLESKMKQQITEYREKLGAVLDHIRSWGWDDPVSTMYRELFRPAVVMDAEGSKDELLRDHARRMTNRIPPGYKDVGKEDEGIGDVLIWHTILRVGRERKENLIFVSGDEKSDWWHQSEKEALYPRFELVSEYWNASGGKGFQIIKFSRLLELFGARVEVVSEVQQEESLQHPTASHSEALSRSAATYVKAWATTEYQAKAVAPTKERGLWDFVLRGVDDKKIGVDVRSYRNNPLYLADLAAIVARTGEIARGDIRAGVINRGLIVFVLNTRQRASSLARRAHTLALPRSFRVVTGYIDPTRGFVMVGDIASTRDAP